MSDRRTGLISMRRTTQALALGMFCHAATALERVESLVTQLLVSEAEDLAGIDATLPSTRVPKKETGHC